MIQNIPSVYNQPTIYNGGGGGLPGDFGKGAGLVPTGYRQVAGVYVRHKSGTNAMKLYSLNNIFGVSLSDITGIKVKGKFLMPDVRPDGYSISTYFFRIEPNGGGSYFTFGGSFPSLTYCNLYLDCGNGVSQPHYNGNFPKIFEATMTSGTADINGQTFTTAYTPPISTTDPRVSPFCVRRYTYDVDSMNIATLYAKYYNANDELMLYFIPAIREADGMPGLYELVHDVFCDNEYCNVIEKIEE